MNLMGFISLRSWSGGASTSLHLLRQVGPYPKLYDARAVKFETVRASSSRKSLKKLRRESQQSKDITTKRSVTEADKEEEEVIAQVDDSSNSKDPVNVVVVAAPRDKVLQACTVTSGLMAALGLVIRTASHVASSEGLPTPDCSADIPFGFETWHLGLIAGTVVLISSSRFLLLKSWADFADSSEAANQQILTSLEPLDYLVVATLPGLSEEMLFRGALMPLFGTSWVSIVGVGLIFGLLHLGSGRKYSFAVWVCKKAGGSSYNSRRICLILLIVFTFAASVGCIILSFLGLSLSTYYLLPSMSAS